MRQKSPLKKKVENWKISANSDTDSHWGKYTVEKSGTTKYWQTGDKTVVASSKEEVLFAETIGQFSIFRRPTDT